MNPENNKEDQDELVNHDAYLEAGTKGQDEPPSPSSSAECKICQAEEFIYQLESPCHCSGTLKYVHRKCIQRWINVSYNTICEICEQQYAGGFPITVPPPPTPEVMEAQRTAQMAREEARIAAGEALAAMLPDLNNTTIGESVVCRISSILCAGLYIIFMVALLTGLLDFRVRPPPSPAPQTQAPDQLPQFFMINTSARALRFWL